MRGLFEYMHPFPLCLDNNQNIISSSFHLLNIMNYRGVNKGLHVLLSRTQAGPGRTVEQEQEDISRNHVQTFIYLSV